jgi:DNA-binding CsgD family transcriptional regulator
MQQPQQLTEDNESVLEQTGMTLLDDRHWRYLQRRYYISPRELQVARLICYGFNNAEIAKDLNIKRGTVKTHVRNIYRRIRVKNKLELLLTFLRDAAGFSAESGLKLPVVQILDTSNQGKKTAHKSLKIPPKG